MPATATPTRNTESEAMMVDPKLIDVRENFNPRQDFGGPQDKALTENVRHFGVLQSLLVSAKDDGRFELIAGERRLRAALLVERQSVPVTIRADQSSASTFALLENIQRRDLNPVEEAQAIDQLLKQTGLSKSKLAAELSVSPSHVTERQRLLSLDQRTQQAIIEGSLPVSATRFLEKVAKASPAAAEHVTWFLLKESSAHMRTHPEEYAYQLLRAVSENVGNPIEGLPALECVAFCGSRLTAHNIAIAWPEPQKALATTFATHCSNWRWDYSVPELDDAAIKAIGAAAQVSQDLTVLFDRDTLIHIIDAAVLDWEKQRDSEAQSAAKAAKATSTSVAAGTSGESGGEAEVTISAYERRQAEQQSAYDDNTKLGNNLLKKLGTIKPTVAIIKTLALAYLDQNTAMAGAGIALTDERLHKVEVKEFKNGNSRTKVTYLETLDAHKELLARINRAKTIDEVLGTLFTAIVAADCVNGEAMPVSDRRSWHSSIFSSYSRNELALKELAKLKAKVIMPLPEAKTNDVSKPARPAK